MTHEDAVGRDVLESRCALLEIAVRNARTVTAEAINNARPGGSENPDCSALGWLYFFGALKSWHAQGPQQTSKKAMRWDPEEIEDLRAALHAEPIALGLQSGERVSVYPKGEHAIAEIALNQIALRWITARRFALGEADPTLETITAYGLALDAERQLNAEFVAIVTHPGAGIPWEDGARWDRAVPAFSRDLTPFDLLAIRRAHVDINLLRVNVIAERARDLANVTGDGPPVEVFLSALAGELHMRPERLVKEWSRGEVFALAVSRHVTTQHATEQAEQKAAAERAR